MTDRTGQLFGKYRLGHLLGHGGFADVYLGEHIYLKTQAAVKILHARVEGDDSTAFQNEARMVANLQHPHIVRVLDYDVTPEGDPFFVMEYAPNGSLRRRHPRGTRLPLDLIVSYTRQVADGLQCAHDQRLIHCDIKPENMLLSSSNQVLLSDFGVAVMAHTSRSQNMQEVSGTAAYMAPEQTMGKAVPASDQYALAVVVYEWLTGDYPFRGTLVEIVSQHVMASPRPPREIVPSLPAEVEQVVLMALAKDPRQRFARVEAFSNALTQASASVIMQPSDSATFIVPPLPPGASSGPIPSGSSVSAATISAPGSPTIRPTQSGEFTVISEPSLTSLNALNTPALTPPTSVAPLGQTAPPGEISQTTKVDMPDDNRKRRAIVSRRSLLIGGVGVITLTASGTLFAFAERAGIGGKGPLTSLTPRASARATTAPTATPSPAPTARPTPSPTPRPKPSPTPQPAPTSPPQPTQPPEPTQPPQPTQPPAPTVLTYFTYSGPSNMYTVAYSPNGTWIACAGNGGSIEVLYAGNGGTLYSIPSGSSTVYSIAWSPDSNYIVSGQHDGTIKMWKAADGSLINSWNGYSSSDAQSQVNCVAWSPNGSYIASASGNKTVSIWNAGDGSEVYTYRGHTHYVDTVAWSSDNTMVASGGGDATAQVWDPANGNTIMTYTGHSSDVVSLAWDPTPGSTRIASGSNDQTVQVWDARSNTRYFSYTGHSDYVVAVAWSPDTSRIASGSRDTTVQVWSATQGSRLVTYNGHSNEVEGVAWSPDSSRVASASDDGTVRVWKAS